VNKRKVVRLMAALSLVPLLGGMIAAPILHDAHWLIAGLTCCGLFLLLGLYVSD